MMCIMARTQMLTHTACYSVWIYGNKIFLLNKLAQIYSFHIISRFNIHIQYHIVIWLEPRCQPFVLDLMPIKIVRSIEIPSIPSIDILPIESAAMHLDSVYFEFQYKFCHKQEEWYMNNHTNHNIDLHLKCFHQNKI